MDRAREQFVDALQDQAVTEVRRALAAEVEKVRARARRWVIGALLILSAIIFIYYGVALLWSTVDLHQSRSEFVTVCETYARRPDCVRQFDALSRLDNTFAIGAQWWWLVKLVWPAGTVLCLYLIRHRATGLVAVGWAVWRLSQAA
jgi:hypothetical protein